jgi:alcohol dehydrogenase (NADP+)
MAQSYKFEGWVAHDPSAIDGKMQWGPFEPKKFHETDVDIEITHCGVCGSDLHTLRSGWGPSAYPLVVGHEIIGKAVRVGNEVKHIKVGDRVGVGAQSDSCLQRKGDCDECANGIENHCQHMTNTYGDTYYVDEGEKSYGGYATYNRAPGHFVFKIPDAIESKDAAPMLCGGITVYSPLKHNGCGPGKKVGIIGVGGLGHFGVLFAKAMGADEVVGISRKKSKESDVLKLGANRYISTDEDKDWAKKNVRSLDLITCTVSSPKMPLTDYLGLLRVGGRLIQVGAPEGPLPQIMAFDFIPKGIFMGGSIIGSPADIREMLQVAADKKVKPWIEERPMKDANKVILDMDQGKARYRYTLAN